MDQQSISDALRDLLSLDDADLCQIIAYTNELNDTQATQHLEDLLGCSSKSSGFISNYLKQRHLLETEPRSKSSTDHEKRQTGQAFAKADAFQKALPDDNNSVNNPPPYQHDRQPQFVMRSSEYAVSDHTNNLIKASRLRAIDEQKMIQYLQQVQLENGIYNSEIEPEHDVGYPCNCSIHQYKLTKWARLGVQEKWSKAVMYPGEKSYNDNANVLGFTANPYQLSVISPYGIGQQVFSIRGRPIASYHARFIRQTIDLSRRLDREAQAKVDAMEPSDCIWKERSLPSSMAEADHKNTEMHPRSLNDSIDKSSGNEKSGMNLSIRPKSVSRLSSFRKAIGVRSSEERRNEKTNILRVDILHEEMGRWPDSQWRQIVSEYQERIGIAKKVAELRENCPIQYLHLLKAGYFEPIPVEWAVNLSNPLKFKIEAASGWRGITPAWRGFEDLAEERLYWVLNHREGYQKSVMKPDFMSTMRMALERMAQAVEPPPVYSSKDDICNIQHTSTKYSKQVMPRPFHAYDRPRLPTDDTMILLDVSGSMDFDPVRPIYDQYLITNYVRSSQPKNKDVARSIIRRFTEALLHEEQEFADGYDLVTFANEANYIGAISSQNFNKIWRNINFGGGTRVMVGWQRVKDLHFRKHSQSAVYHPVYGWQAGPQTPMLRLLLLLDGEAVDMDEFELDLLSLNWAHVTIFLIGVDGCPHHHRHANELQRISDVNRHVSFVDAQGNIPERFVTHELLKRHLGYDISMDGFTRMEGLPSYSES